MRILVRPEDARPEPPPANTDNQRVFAVATILWSVALVVLIAVWLVTKNQLGHPIAITATGTAIGIATLLDQRRRARPGFKGNR